MVWSVLEVTTIDKTTSNYADENDLSHISSSYSFSSPILEVSFTIDSSYDWERHSNFRSDMYTGDRGIYFTVELQE